MEMEDKSGSRNVVNAENIKIEEASWWQRRSKLEKKLVVLFVLILLVAIALVIVLIVLQVQRSEETQQQTTPSVPRQPDICMTPGCVQTAARILDRANFSADPCEDFYEYACGSWMKKNDIAENQAQKTIFTHLTDNLNRKLKDLMEASPKEGEAGAIKKARDLYKSCLNLDKIESKGSKPLLDTLSEFGGWPILNPAWDVSSFQLQSILIKLKLYSEVPLILMGFEFHPHNTSEFILSFDQPGLGMPGRDYYLRCRNDTALMAYQTFIIKVAEALGANRTSAETQAKEIVDFEIQLANITVPATQRGDLVKRYNLMTVREMLQMYPAFDWLGYLQGIMSVEAIGISITADEVIINKSPPYFEKLFILLGNTRVSVQANYLMWMFTIKRLKLLGSTFTSIVQDYSKALLGTTAAKPRWQFCINEVNTVMSLAVGRLFVDAHFDETAKTTLVELISYLRDAFNELIEEADWMDNATCAVALEKAAVIEEKIGYPDALKNNSYLDKEYKVFNFSTTLFFENVNHVLQLVVTESLKLLRDNVDKSLWIKPPALVGAFYNPAWNEIIFPAGILQSPFYGEKQPWSINFGSIGSFIGHEITHGFDTTGLQYDKDGALRRWWSNDTLLGFINRAKCIVQQTSSFYVPEAGRNVNGLLTIGEDVADNGGMKESYRGYRKWVSKRGREEPLLPGVSLNNNQLFFLAWAQVWCSKIRPEGAILLISADSHSPNRIRAFSPMRNMPEFAQAYSCPEGSPMNPVKKCSVW